VTKYPKPSLTADALVFTGQGETMKVLLIRRGNPPFQGEWAFPGGFANPGEPVFQACVRELEEETGLILHPAEGIPLSFRAKAGRDPRGWTVSQPVLFHIPEEKEVMGLDDAECAEFVPVSEVPKLAFDHGAILCEALGKFWFGMSDTDPRLFELRGFGELYASNSRELTPEVIFYGGTFNPWHEGHHACLQQVLELDSNTFTTVVIPDTNPFKSGMKDVCFWEFYRNLRTEIPPKTSIFPGFCGMEIPNPTQSWIFRTSWPKKNLVMGDDCMIDLPRWYHAEQLLRGLHRIFVVPRDESSIDLDRAEREIKALAPNLLVERLSPHPFQNISSSGIRKGKTP